MKRPDSSGGRTRVVAPALVCPVSGSMLQPLVRILALSFFLLVVLALFVPLVGPVLAQARPDGPLPESQKPEVAPGNVVPEAPSKDQLRGIETQIEKSGFEQRRLGYEIENLSVEAQKLRAGLIETARKVREAEERLAEQGGKLEGLQKQENALRRSLQSRERVTAEVLAAMQRIGRKPPPALLVAPEDVLSAMRAAILLGAVLPEMRDEAMILVADLKTLTELRRQSGLATEQLRRDRDLIDTERNRLAELVAARQGQISLSKEQLDQERTRVATLTREARSLRDLIARSENDIVGNSRAAEIARRAPAPAKAGTVVASLRPDAAGRDAVRLQPRQAFSERRGLVPFPASGTVSRFFGQPDGFGGTERGITISSNPNAVVTAPGDGWVHFAGPYRGYGHLLIINAGSGYHVVLAGMERLTVEIGQFVLAGEPVGFLGTLPSSRNGEAAPKATDSPNEAGQSLQSAPNSRTGSDSPAGNGSQVGPDSQVRLGGLRPALYVEFRKDGSPVDPSPWWFSHTAEKARG